MYFCLPALRIPALARLIGKLAVNDLKTAVADQIAKDKRDRLPVNSILEEFSVVAGEQVYCPIHQGRSANLHLIFATQSATDIDRAVTDRPDYFLRQMFANGSKNLIQRLKAAQDVTAMAEMIGTDDAVEHTAQAGNLGAIGLGSTRRTRAFAMYPDVIKRLPRGKAPLVRKSHDVVQQVLAHRGRSGEA